MNDKPVILITEPEVIETEYETIYDYDKSHVIYKMQDLGSFIELRRMKIENEELKREVKTKYDGLMAITEEVCEYAKENDKLRNVIDKAIHALKDMQFQYEGLGDLDVVMKILEMEDKHE